MTWLGWWIMTRYFSDFSFEYYFFIPASYYIAGVFLILVLSRAQSMKPQRLAQVYLLLHISKFVLFAAIALFFVVFLGIKSKFFMVLYASYYFVFLAFETLCILSIEKHLKKLGNEQKITI